MHEACITGIMWETEWNKPTIWGWFQSHRDSGDGLRCLAYRVIHGLNIHGEHLNIMGTFLHMIL